MNANAYNVYKETQVQTAPGLELVLLLYNGGIKFLKQARQAVAEKKFENAHTLLVKAQDIISELNVSLNHEVGGEISRGLEQLYEYMNWKLVHANIHKEVEPIDEVIGMMEELRNTWAEIGKKQDVRKGTSPGLNVSK